MKNAKAKNVPLVDKIGFIPIRLAEAIAWLVNPKTGGVIVFFTAALYFLFISVEVFYTAAPASSQALNSGLSNFHFLPKPGIDDGANFNIINPLIPLLNLFFWLCNNTLDRLPLIKFLIPTFTYNNQWTVYQDPHFLWSFALCLVVQAVETAATTRGRKDWNENMERFNDLNNKKIPELNADALVAASFVRNEMKLEGTSDYVANTLIVIGVYVFEIAAFVLSIQGSGVGFMALLIYGFFAIWGFELFFTWGYSSLESQRKKAYKLNDNR